MKAVAIFPNKREISVIDHPEPTIDSPTQVKLRMLEVGVCGTDKELCSFDYGTPPPGSDYLIIGHESLGEIIEVGAKVTHFKKGDLAYVMVRRPCSQPTCSPCRAGRQDFCVSGDFSERGINKLHGFMTEFVVDEEKYMVAVPSSLRKVGVLIDPLTIAEKAMEQLWIVQERLPWEIRHKHGKHGAAVNHHGNTHCAVVLGAGPVGLLGAMLLVQQGFKTVVYSRELEADKAEFVKSFGANYVSAATHSVDQLATQVGNIDLVYEATGAAQVSFDLLKVLGTNGVFVFTGVPGRKGPIQIDADLIMRNLVLKNQLVLGSVNNSYQNAVNAVSNLDTFAKKWPATVAALITHQYSLDTSLLQEVLLGRVGGIKNVIRFT